MPYRNDRHFKRCGLKFNGIPSTSVKPLVSFFVTGRKSNYDVNRSFNIENEINNFLNQLRSQNINDVNNHEYTYAIGTLYMDIIGECEKLGDYVINVVEARMDVRQREA